VISGEAHGYHLAVTGEPESDDDFLLILNADPEPLVQTLPPPPNGETWETLLDTARGNATEPESYKAGEAFTLEPRSLALLVRRNGGGTARTGDG
jgi:hypothetical protein